MKAAVLGIQAGIENIEERTQNFKLREEQERAIGNTLTLLGPRRSDVCAFTEGVLCCEV